MSPIPTMLRAPNVAVGGLADEPGWATTAPPLCVDYVDQGRDEPGLQKKIVELLRCGTRFVWVVRLAGPRRVEVYEPGKMMRTVVATDVLEAPGILKNAVPVEALYNREAAHRHTLKNLLQREGYEDLEAVKAEGREEELRHAIEALCEVLAIAPAPEQSAALRAMGVEALVAQRDRLTRERRW